MKSRAHAAIVAASMLLKKNLSCNSVPLAFLFTQYRLDSLKKKVLTKRSASWYLGFC